MRPLNQSNSSLRLLPSSRALENDVIESADAAQPLAQRLADASVGHVAGELAEAGVERRLERQERGVRQEEDLIEESQDHVGPRLQTDGQLMNRDERERPRVREVQSYKRETSPTLSFNLKNT